MLQTLRELSVDFQQSKLDHERETQFNRDYQREKQKLVAELDDYRTQGVSRLLCPAGR